MGVSLCLWACIHESVGVYLCSYGHVSLYRRREPLTWACIHETLACAHDTAACFSVNVGVYVGMSYVSLSKHKGSCLNYAA